jgi:MerR family mercuric resistance operon transcriptional regulator
MSLTIGQVAREAGMRVETVRYYEREGLLAPPGRSRSGYRQYPGDTVRRLLFIRHAKELGFSLREIGELLELRRGPRVRCDEVRKRAQAKIRDVECRIDSLERIRRALTRLAQECESTGTGEACPILDALGNL